MVLYKLSLGDINGEVVELVYGTSLENWRRFVAYRGFESHPLRHFFIKNMEQYPRGSRGRFAKPLDRVTGAGVRTPSAPPVNKKCSIISNFFYFLSI